MCSDTDCPQQDFPHSPHEDDRTRAGDAEQDYTAHDVGYVVDDIEETEAMTDACTGCGATKSDDGWTVHPSDCPMVALSPEGKRIIDEKVESVRQARLAAMEGAHGYVIG